MKKIKFLGPLFFLLILGAVAVPVLADFKNVSQQPEEPQATIKILTLNVMQNASEARASRFQKIVDFLKPAPVHLLALQELSGGPQDTPATQDSGADLAGMLAAAGLEYGYYTEANWGYPPYLVFKVGILPRYSMIATAAGCTGTPGDGWVFPERKNVVMAAMIIPGFGRVNLYSVHVYTPAAEGIEAQIDSLMAFVEQTDGQYPAAASIVGGDLNFSVDTYPAAYQKFLDHGFADTYAAANCPGAPQNCCTQEKTQGCTFRAPGNPLASSGAPSRIDFLLVRGKGMQVKQSQVVFNGGNGPFVSDHCGVLTEIAKPAVTPPAFLLLGNKEAQIPLRPLHP
jgi:endonuclease/exonuclease/phosphatase family metal-dependent hydrolase